MTKIKLLKFKDNSKAKRFFEVCNLDEETGYSDIVKFDEYPELRTTNGGDWCRDDSQLGKRYNIIRKKDKGQIVSVQLGGYKKNDYKRAVPAAVKVTFKGSRCVVLNIGGNKIEIDHKDGRYDLFEEVPSKDSKKYQPMHKTVNDAKRTHCNKCEETGTKFDARNLGFAVSQWIGEEKYMGSCIGCYWHDPKEFNERVSESFVKKR